MYNPQSTANKPGFWSLLTCFLAVMCFLFPTALVFSLSDSVDCVKKRNPRVFDDFFGKKQLFKDDVPNGDFSVHDVSFRK